MECNFVVGQKVVRIGGTERINVPATWPEMGKVYTVRAINVWHHVTLIRLEEIDNSNMVPEYGKIDPGFQAAYFRPVIQRKISIEVFKKMLIPSKAKETA